LTASCMVVTFVPGITAAIWRAMSPTGASA
jgi:hypothetical protein